jgi:hypothetical protein
VRLAGNFGDDPTEIDAARIKLANAILSIASEHSMDAEVLRKAALQRMALGWRNEGSPR